MRTYFFFTLSQFLSDAYIYQIFVRFVMLNPITIGQVTFKLALAIRKSKSVAGFALNMAQLELPPGPQCPELSRLENPIPRNPRATAKRTEFDFIKLTFHVPLMNKVKTKIMMQLVSPRGVAEWRHWERGGWPSKRVAFTKNKRRRKAKNAARCCRILLLATRCCGFLP